MGSRCGKSCCSCAGRYGEEDDLVHRKTKRGDTFQFQVQIFGSPPVGSPPCTKGPPQNVAGWFMWCTLKNNYADPDNANIGQATTGTSTPPTQIVYIQPLSGIVQITFSPLVTYALPDTPSRLRYDVQVQDPSGNIFTVEEGDVTVTPDVTRAIAPSYAPPIVETGVQRVYSGQPPVLMPPGTTTYAYPTTTSVTVIPIISGDNGKYTIIAGLGCTGSSPVLVTAPGGGSIQDPQAPTTFSTGTVSLTQAGETVNYQWDITALQLRLV